MTQIAMNNTYKRTRLSLQMRRTRRSLHNTDATTIDTSTSSNGLMTEDSLSVGVLTDANLQREIERQINEEGNGGDGGDSDIEGDEFQLHDFHSICGGDERSDDDSHVVTESKFDGSKFGAILKLTANGSTEVIGDVASDGSDAANNPYNVSIPSPSSDWVPPPVKTEKGEPQFSEVDNPGKWSRFIFKPKFKKDGQYLSHQLPTGAMPVPVGPDGKRRCGNWQFYYDGFKNQEMPYRRGATTSNLFPKEMEGCLDVNVLKRLGLTKERITCVDALFFYQLLLPICDPSKSGIADDPRIAYYTDVEKFTNASKHITGQGVSYGHKWKVTSAGELLQFDGIVAHDGVKGGSNGALYRRWDIACPEMYSEAISKTMTLTRFGELKRSKKLCLNNDKSNPARGEPGYNPAYKFDLIYKCIVQNTNAITKKADENQVLDETTWGHSGYGESGSGLSGRLRNKPVSKGGQVVMVMDANRLRPRAYMHRHKLYHEVFPEKNNWSKNGPFELYNLSKELLKMVDDSGDQHTKKIFRKKPCITADNYFIDDQVLDWIGEQGLGAVGTNARDKLPKDIPPAYLHKNKTAPKNQAAKVARYAPPIIAVKDDPHRRFQRVHVSFQSTSSCNIATVNALNEVFNYVELRERGRGANKRYWVIEMNHGRRIYLTTYNGIDIMDHLIKNARIYYRTWKYWHAPTNHAHAMVIAVAYDIYIECCEGEIEEEWKVEKPVSSWDFQRILSMQMLTYLPSKVKYPGDEKMRAVTVSPKRKRNSNLYDRKVSMGQLRVATRSVKSRGCGDLDKLCRHVNSIESISKARICAWCGMPTYQVCSLCCGIDGKAVPLHFKTRKKDGDDTTKPPMCFWHYHNNNMLGLGKNDRSQLLKQVKGEWKEPSKQEKDINRTHIQKLSNSHTGMS